MVTTVEKPTRTKKAPKTDAPTPKPADSLTSAIVAAALVEQAELSTEIVNDYVSHGYLPENAQFGENVRLYWERFKSAENQGPVALGAALNTIKDGMPHGQWKWYYETHLNMGKDRASRYLAAFSAVQAEPLLLEVLSNIDQNVLYGLGSSKRVTPAIRKAVVEMARDREVHRNDLDALITAMNPSTAVSTAPGEYVVPQVDFDKPDQGTSEQFLISMRNLGEEALQVVEQAELDLGKISTGKAYKNFFARLRPDVDNSNEPFIELLQAILETAFACYVGVDSYEEIDYRQDDRDSHNEDWQNTQPGEMPF